MNPNSRLWLCKTNLENDYKNTLTFSSKNNQRNYFIGDPSSPSSYGVSTKMYTDFTYLRIENAIKVDDFIETIDTNNYAVILNNSKYYYYFITSMDYIDDQTTRIHIELDVMQTYFFDITYTNTFVERKHVSDDTIGKNTVPEGLETGEYIVNTYTDGQQPSQTQDLGFLSTCYPVFAITNAVTGTSSGYDASNKYNGCWSGLKYMVVKNTDVDFARAIQGVENTTDCELYAIFMAPKKLVNPTETWYTGTDWMFDYFYIPSFDGAIDMGGFSINKATKLDGDYTPKNKKLLCYPYNYFLINNHSGNVAEFHYEDWTDVSGAEHQICGFGISGAVSVGCDIRLTPSDRYKKGRKLNRVEMFKLPTCSWISDAYTNWLTQNAVNDKISAVGTAGEVVLGSAISMLAPSPMAKLAGMAMVGDAVVNVFNSVRSGVEHERVPDQAKGGINEGTLNFAEGASFTITRMSIKKEYAKIIDQFFEQFGYKVNVLEVPNIHTRRYWNYLKTIGCNFTGDIPQQYMDRIKKIFDAGITFWHDPSKMLDYSQTNSILS